MPLSRELMRRPRIVLPLQKRGVEGAYHLGRYNNVRAKPALPEHLHRGAFEICFMVRGCQTYRVGNEDFRMRGGDVFMTFPDEEHSTGGSPEEKGVLYWLVLLEPQRGESLLGLPPAQSRSLADALHGIRPRRFRGTWAMKEHLDEVVSLCSGRAMALREVKLSHHLLAFVLEVLAASKREGGQSREKSLAPVLFHIRENLGEGLSVPRLAALAGLSTARFKARFREESGLPPGEYVLRARVEEAGRRLYQGRETVTQVAHDLGFSSSQYFATVFKRFTGRSPRELLPGEGDSSRRKRR